MTAPKRWRHAFLAAFLLVLIFCIWIIFAPPQVGGQSSYVIVTGDSMEPGFHIGDLVIVRQQPVYRIGDIVVYNNAELRNYVIHRIYGKELDHFILKGDHNSWTDSYKPTQAEVIGKLWIRIPKIGNIIKELRNPFSMAILAACLGILVMVILMGSSKHGGGMNSKQKNERVARKSKLLKINLKEKFKVFSLANIFRSKQPATTSLVPESSDQDGLPIGEFRIKGLGARIETPLFILGFIALAALALVLYSFTQPVWLKVDDNINFQQFGSFTYTSAAPAGIYDTNTVISGDPIFPAQTCAVDLQFTYIFLGDQLQTLAGTHQLTATILEKSSGWKREIPLEAPTQFSGSSFVSDARLDLCQIETIVNTMEAVTGLHQSSYSLIIAPRVAVTGIMTSRGFETTFEPHLSFLFDKLHFYLDKNDPDGTLLNPSQTGFIAGTRQQANKLSLLGLKPEVGKMRVLSMIGLFLSLGGLSLLGIHVSNQVRGNKEALIQMKYGSFLVDVRDQAQEMSLTAIDVSSMDDMTRLAEQNNGVILHEAHGQTNYYFVQGDRVIYRFMSNVSGNNLLNALPSQLEENMRRGIERGEFQIFYQPIKSLVDGRISAVEALLRWEQPERGLISAIDFIFTAEKTGLIDWIGNWMLQVAGAQLMEWQKAGYQTMLAVNLSKHQLEEKPVDIIARALHKTGMDPHSLQIEIPEASLVEKNPVVLTNLLALGDLGIRISVDGFTGHLSLSSLKKFRISSVKLDRNFVARINRPEIAATVSAMITAVQKLGLTVVAGGVETEEQLKFLKDHRCTLVQGYLVGRPAPADVMTLLLENSRNPAGQLPSRHQPPSSEAA